MRILKKTNKKSGAVMSSEFDALFLAIVSTPENEDEIIPKRKMRGYSRSSQIIMNRGKIRRLDHIPDSNGGSGKM